jgi:hypothetical protein
MPLSNRLALSLKIIHGVPLRQPVKLGVVPLLLPLRMHGVPLLPLLRMRGVLPLPLLRMRGALLLPLMLPLLRATSAKAVVARKENQRSQIIRLLSINTCNNRRIKRFRFPSRKLERPTKGSMMRYGKVSLSCKRRMMTKIRTSLEK